MSVMVSTKEIFAEFVVYCNKILFPIFLAINLSLNLQFHVDFMLLISHFYL